MASAPQAVPQVRRALLRWYDRNRRDLPWRESRDPYRIWVSEIMLQQTRVAAVLEHYRLFLERFPDVESLASSPESAVLAAWSGLGYYRRARLMHRCAKELSREYNGIFPSTAEALRELPGIGRYTAAAISSIVFDEPIAVVDGNVTRVLQRICGTQLPGSEIWRKAQLLVSRSRPGDFNQALMELGATLCTPRQPSCTNCPIRQWCKTRGELRSQRVPASQKKREIWCALDQRDGHIRLVRRSQRGKLMPGMWELPQFVPDGRRKELDAACWRTFRHSITVTDYTVRVVRGAGPGKQGKWVAVGRIPEIPITGLTRKILRAGGII